MTEEKYQGIIVPDGAVGIKLRHFFVEPPVKEEDIASIEQATGSNHVNSDEKWSKFTIGSTYHLPTDEIFVNAQKAFETAGHTLVPLEELSSSVSMQEFRRFVALRTMKYDNWDPNYPNIEDPEGY